MDIPAKRKTKLTLMIVLTLLVSSFSILSDLINFETHDTAFSPWFWLNLILTNVSAIVIIFLSNSTEKDILTASNKRYLELSGSLYSSFCEINNKNLRQAFSEYVKKDNESAKKDAYLGYLHAKKAKCEMAISKLERRYNSNRLFFGKEVIDRPSTPSLLLYRSRLDYWNKRIQTADVDVKYANVKYLKVSEDSIFAASEDKQRASRDLSYHAAQHNMEILAKKFLLVIIIGFSASLGFSFSPVQLSVEFFYKTAIRLFQLGMALYTGISDADKFVKEDMCAALYRRIAYVQKFKEYMLKQKGGESE